MNKTFIWISLVAIPLVYALARNLANPISTLLLLHWGITTGILIWAYQNRDGIQGFDFHSALVRFTVFLFVVSAYCTLLITFFGSRELADWQYAQIHLGIGRWGVLFTAISAGFCEEVIFRGYLITGLKRAKQKAAVAIILSTLSFVFMHGVLPIPFFIIFFLLGVVIALIYHLTSNLWWSIYVHALWDASVLLIPLG